MSKRRLQLHKSSITVSMTFLLLIMLALTDVLIYSIHFMVGVENGFYTIFSIPKVTAKSDVDSIIITTPHRIMEEVNSTNLEKNVHDLSSFHTRQSESKFIDDVAYWLRETSKRLQNGCLCPKFYTCTRGER